MQKIHSTIKCPGKHQLKYSKESLVPNRTPKCDFCKQLNIHKNVNGYLYCLTCNFDACYNCSASIILNLVKNEMPKQSNMHQKIQDQCAKAAIKKAIDKAVEQAAGGVVPGIGAIVLQHVLAPYQAAQGDGLGAVKTTIGGFTTFSGAIIGTAICPGIGTALGGIIGGIVGMMGGYGVGKLVQK